MSDETNEPSFEIQGVRFSWKTTEGLFCVFDMPVIAMWVDSSVAGLMQGMQRMVGTERFNLSMHGGGRDSVDGDWSVITSVSTFEAGFDLLGSYAVTCGWGEWRLVSVDREARRAVFRTVNNWEALYQRSLGVDWGSSMTGGKFAGLCTRLFGVNCWATQTSYQATGADYDEFVVTPSDQPMEQRYEQLLSSDHATRADLAVALKRLEDENEARKRSEREAQDRLATIESLSAPILHVWDGVLALPVLGSLSGERATTLMERLLEEIQRTQSSWAILDVTGVEMIDTHTADHLLKIARAIALLGGECIITGVQPAVAQTMASLDMGLTQITTRATLRDGIKYCMKSQARGT